MSFRSANLFTVKQVCDDHIFVVPEFQRGYAWGPEQWKALWEDVTNVARRGAAQHYGGAIMISSDTHGVREVELIDGQQRLTSISLMLASIGDAGFPIQFRNNEPLQTYFDYYALKQGHLGPRLKLHRSYYARNIADASDYFSARAESMTTAERAELAKVLWQRFKLFVLVIQPDFDVHVAFETINNRGKPLSTLEKLKNRLIYLASNAQDAEEGREAVADVHRCWKHVYSWLGAGRALLDDDDFLRAHSMGWFRHERKAEWLTSQLFDEEFSAYGAVAPTEIRTYVRSLELAAACWHLINEPEDMPPFVAKRLSALQKTANATTRPLLLWALIRLAQEHPRLVHTPDVDTGWAAPFAALLAQAERFGVLVVLANNRPSNVGQSDINRSAFALAHPGEPPYIYRPDLVPPMVGEGATKFATDHLASLIYNIEHLVHDEDDEENESYRDKRFPWKGYFDPEAVQRVTAERLRKNQGFYNWQFGKLLIYLWEEHLRGDKGRAEKKSWERFAWDESVEHIFPQNPDKEWQEAFSLNGRSPLLARSTITNSLGNLLLLSRSINSSVSNDPYPKTRQSIGKRGRYANGSYSEIQIAQLCDKWTIVQIAARGIAVLKHAQDVWDFEVVSPNEKITNWLPLLFGDLAERVQQGDYSYGRAITQRTLQPWVEKFSAPL